MGNIIAGGDIFCKDDAQAKILFQLYVLHTIKDDPVMVPNAECKLLFEKTWKIIAEKICEFTEDINKTNTIVELETKNQNIMSLLHQFIEQLKELHQTDTKIKDLMLNGLSIINYLLDRHIQLKKTCLVVQHKEKLTAN